MSEPGAAWTRKPRVLVTRATGQASALADELSRLGAEPISVPLIEIVTPDSFNELDAALASISAFNWLLFTSANAVEALVHRAQARGIELSLDGLKLAAIGSATARALAANNMHVDLVPPLAVAESLAEALLPFARRANGQPTKFLLVRAQEGREHLPDALREAGAEVAVVPAYKTRVPAEGIAALKRCFNSADGPPDAVTLTSSSAAHNFFALLAAASLNLSSETAVASIGPITTATLRQLGHAPDVEAAEASVASLAKTVVEYLSAREQR